MSNILPAISALGTRWHIELFTDECDSNAIHTDLLSYISTYEKRYSRFLGSSLVSTLNKTGAVDTPDQAFIDILTYGQNLYTKTNGTFNILVGAELSARGYNSAYTFTPEQPHSTQIIPSPQTDLHISSERITLTAGGLDLGGFGKGYLIDLVAKRLTTVHHIDYFLINAGGDMYGTSDNGTPITIYLEHPNDATQSIFTTSLHHQGFAASSAQKRRWTHENTNHTHLVATTEHIADLDTVASYVIADSATAADVLATTSLLTSTAPSTFIREAAAIIARFDTTTNQLTSTAPLPAAVLQS